VPIAVLFIIAIALQIAAPVVARAQTSASGDAEISKKVDAYVAAEMRTEKMPGLALAVVRDGQIIKARGYGLANIELDVPVKPETIFQTGSVGKQFTATAVMMLVEDGKIRLDDPIRKYLPGSPATWDKITVRNLLTHTSGIPDYESDSLKKKGAAFVNLRNDYTEDELFKKFSGLPLDFPPGSQWRYSNSGYVILGILIHKVTGQFYGDVLQERIFRPLGMASTRIISEADIIPNRAAGLPAGEWGNKKSGMGFANAQYHCGWRALHQRSGYGEMGRGALWRKVVEEGKSRPDVDGGPFERWENGRVRIWMGH
jgi:CubicO group peptidase (beta-lactamase class C family)